MLDVSSRPHDSFMRVHRIADVPLEGDDWELVIREAHHRMKNTLMLLVAWLKLFDYLAVFDTLYKLVVMIGARSAARWTCCDDRSR